MIYRYSLSHFTLIIKCITEAVSTSFSWYTFYKTIYFFCLLTIDSSIVSIPNIIYTKIYTSFPSWKMSQNIHRAIAFNFYS